MSKKRSDEVRLIAIDPSFTGTGVVTYIDGEWNAFLIQTERAKSKCAVCGKEVGDPKSRAHVKSEHHQEAMRNPPPSSDERIVALASPTIDYTKRIMKICDEVNAICNGKRITHAIIEGMAFGASGRAKLDLGGLSHALRAMLLRRGIALAVVPPTTAKAFWTGKGDASKGDMIAESKKRGIEVPYDYDDNCNDAIVLLTFLKQLLSGDLPDDYWNKVETSWERSAK